MNGYNYINLEDALKYKYALGAYDFINIIVDNICGDDWAVYEIECNRKRPRFLPLSKTVYQ